MPIRCNCGKIVAYNRNGRIEVYCKECKKQIPVVILPQPYMQYTEPMSRADGISTVEYWNRAVEPIDTK